MSSLTEFTDHQLLDRIRDGNVIAFKHLYLRYFSSLCKCGFRRIQNTEIIEEIVQDIFVDLWKQRQKLDSNQEIGAFLNALLRNKVLHEWRANSIRTRHIDLFHRLNTSNIDESLSEDLNVSEIQERLNTVIGNLSPQCRQAFELSRYEELSYREISERMAISVKTVEKHIGKALKILKVKFSEYHLLLILTIYLMMER